MSKVRFGLEYHFALVDANGHRIDSWVEHNLVPALGLEFLMKAPFGDAAAIPSFYLGLYANAYEPTDATVAADIPNNMGEITAYSQTTRPEWVREYSAGAFTSVDSPAEFTMTSDALIRGIFLCSTAAKGVGTGLVLSALRFATARQVYSESTLQLYGSLSYSPVE